MQSIDLDLDVLRLGMGEGVDIRSLHQYRDSRWKPLQRKSDIAEEHVLIH